MMKKLIIVFSALMMLIGITLSVMKALQIGPFAPTTEEVAGAAAPKPAPVEPARFIDLDPLIIPIFHGDSVVTTIQIAVKLETTGSANEGRINRLKPRISDAFIKDLYSFIPRLLQSQERVNVFIIKKRLQMVSEKVAGKGLIDDVLVQAITDTSQQQR